MRTRSVVISQFVCRAILLSSICWSVHRVYPAVAQVQAQGANAKLPTVELVITDWGFSITVPEGFKNRSGTFYHEQLRASLSFAYDPKNNFADAASEFTPEVMEQQGIKLISKESVKVNGSKGLLVHFSRTRNAETKLAWCVIFPSGKGVAQVTAIFPEEKRDSASTPLRDALLSVKHRPKI
jgi:hypothetical protein